MVKIIGGAFIILASSLLGCQSAGRIKAEFKELQYLQQIISLLQSEIRYARSYLGEAFYQIGKRLKEPYREWLTSTSLRLEEKSGGLFAEIWKEGIEEKLASTPITKEEKQRLINLGDQLLSSDVEMQLRTLDLYQEQLAWAMNEKKEGMRTKVRLCHCLGVMGGIFLTILLI